MVEPDGAIDVDAKGFASLLTRWASSALRSSALDGTHPTLKQTPPQYFSSTTATVLPSWEERMAAIGRRSLTRVTPHRPARSPPKDAPPMGSWRRSGRRPPAFQRDAGPGIPGVGRWLLLADPGWPVAVREFTAFKRVARPRRRDGPLHDERPVPRANRSPMSRQSGSSTQTPGAASSERVIMPTRDRWILVTWSDLYGPPRLALGTFGPVFRPSDTSD